MKLNIVQKKEEPLLSRINAEAEVTFDSATPSNKDIRRVLAKSLGKDEKLIDIKGIYNSYGLKQAKVLCYAYESEEALSKIKKEGKKAKEKAEKGKKEQEGKKQEAEAKKEQPKEAPKKEVNAKEAKLDIKKEEKQEPVKEYPKAEEKKEESKK